MTPETPPGATLKRRWRGAGPLSREFCAGMLAAALVCGGGPASAQVLGRLGVPSLPTVGPVLPGGVVRGALDQVEALPDRTLSSVRALRQQTLIRANPKTIDVDDHGEPVVRGEVLAVSPSEESLARVAKAGFTVARESRLEAVDLRLVVLNPPAGMSARQAVKRLHKLDPDGQYDFNHIYSNAGAVLGAAAAPAAGGSQAGSAGSSVRLGLIDSGVPVSHPALAGSHIEQRAFAAGGLKVRDHGAAVASLMVGEAGGFHGAAPGAKLYVADVYGATPTGGSADDLVRALAWMAQEHVPVINVSLVGPPNLTLQAVIRTLAARGEVVVAAVGNDGPAAPPLYPASYPQVVAVTGVDAHRRVLLEAGKAKHLDYAAPGADMAAAGAEGGYISVRGTSFAAPIVAGRLALAMKPGGSAADALAALDREAVDLGARGADPVYGRGLVGAELRTPPAAVSAARWKDR